MNAEAPIIPVPLIMGLITMNWNLAELVQIYLRSPNFQNPTETLSERRLHLIEQAARYASPLKMILRSVEI